uniref:Uncharacterized protein n=1 Tax=Ananas comosus var. bracteatus TaxID=296719 RepID=A0A6V7Q1Y5_ANACO|nr:unnamed protein product [Ananas comosus var. bracteatus]
MRRPGEGVIPPFSTSRRIGISYREPAVPAAASSETDRGKGIARGALELGLGACGRTSTLALLQAWFGALVRSLPTSRHSGDSHRDTCSLVRDWAPKWDAVEEVHSLSGDVDYHGAIRHGAGRTTYGRLICFRYMAGLDTCRAGFHWVPRRDTLSS